MLDCGKSAQTIVKELKRYGISDKIINVAREEAEAKRPGEHTGSEAK